MGSTIEIPAPAACSEQEAKALRAAGFVPVIRWVRREGGPGDVPKSDVAIKTIDALTVLERERGNRADVEKTKAGRSKSPTNKNDKAAVRTR